MGRTIPLWLFWIAAWIVGTLLARPMLGYFEHGFYPDHLRASLVGLIGSLIAMGSVWRDVKPDRRGHLKAYVVPCLLGLAFLVVIAVGNDFDRFRRAQP